MIRARSLAIDGAFLLELERFEDERGFFMRPFAAEEFTALGLPPHFVHSNVSHTLRKDTLRGLHYQEAPHAEGKLITCLGGEVYDVLLDVREGSKTQGKWVAVTLSLTQSVALYAPPGVAHGFLTLTDNVTMHYQMTHGYVASSARGVRWNDPVFAIEWPTRAPLVSKRDADFSPHQGKGKAA